MNYLGDGRCHFKVWAPLHDRVDVHLLKPEDRLVPLQKSRRGYHEEVLEKVCPGSLYFYRLPQGDFPDPASRSQPEGIHGPSEVVNPAFPWDDAHWLGLPAEDYIIYELHTGTFTQEGTFEAIIPHLQYFKDLGMTAIELMPIAQFPGERNWGYDGVFPFAVQTSYGGLQGLKRLVNACHQANLAVVLDVVYNHLGPEGNHLGRFAPYFTDHGRTPWGPAVNFDEAHCDGVREFFIENALYWIVEGHVDALRLDAVHAIFDRSAFPFLEELADTVKRRSRSLSRPAYLIAENALNDPRVVSPPGKGGYGLDMQWNDDFHHALHALLTGDKAGYYQDFGVTEDLARALQEGFVFSGQYSAYRRRRYGRSSVQIPSKRFVVFSQNHDQVGNRARGERLAQLISFEALKLAAGAVLLSPFIPLLFMGEEYGETAPFPFFISHQDPELIEAVRKGRRQEFAGFHWDVEPPDPQAEETFFSAKLNHSLRRQEKHRTLLDFYRELVRLRKNVPVLSHLSKEGLRAETPVSDFLFLHRRFENQQALLLFNFKKECLSQRIFLPDGPWQIRLDSSESRWDGPGSRMGSAIVPGGETQVHLNAESFMLLTG